MKLPLDKIANINWIVWIIHGELLIRVCEIDYSFFQIYLLSSPMLSLIRNTLCEYLCWIISASISTYYRALKP